MKRCKTSLDSWGFFNSFRLFLLFPAATAAWQACPQVSRRDGLRAQSQNPRHQLPPAPGTFHLPRGTSPAPLPCFRVSQKPPCYRARPSSHAVLGAMVSAGVQLTFSLAASVGLCFGLGMKRTLITHRCFQLLLRTQGLFCSSHHLPAMGWEEPQ